VVIDPIARQNGTGKSMRLAFVIAALMTLAIACNDALLLGDRYDEEPANGTGPAHTGGSTGNPPLDASAITIKGGGFVAGGDASFSSPPTDGSTDSDGGSEPAILGLGDKTCTASGWCWISPLAQGNPISALWATAPDDIWAVGPRGLILHRDANAWTIMDSGTTQDLNAVWASGPNDAWTVGQWGTWLHWNGAIWSPLSITTDHMTTVWGSSANDVWVSGYKLYHFDGSGWTTTGVPRAGVAGVVGTFGAIWGSSANDVWASSAEGMAHWNGSAWTWSDGPILPNPATSQTGVIARQMWGSGPNDVYAIGQGIGHWDGTSWTKPAIPSLNGLEAVGGSGPNDVWVVSINEEVTHWDGVAWSPSTLINQRRIGGVTGLWAFAANDMLAVGGGGVAAHYDGAAWTVAPQTFGALGGVWGSSATDAWAATAGGGYHFDGTTWSAVPTLKASLSGIVGTAPNDVWATGTTSVWHWDGGTWSTSPGSTAPVTLNAIGATSPNDVWAVGNDGYIQHFDGTAWSATPIDGKSYPIYSVDLHSVWASGPNEAWATGEWTIHWDGKTWTKWSDQGPPTGVGGYLSGNSLWGSSASDVWLADGWPALRHWDGAGWTTVPVDAPAQVWSVWGRAKNDVWAIGGGTYGGDLVTPFVMHFDGSTWSRSNTGVASGLLSGYSSGHGWTSPAGDVWLIGNGGTILHHDRFPATSPGPALDCSSGGWCWQNPLPQGNTLRAVSGASAKDIWAVGDRYTAIHYDGTAWSSHPITRDLPYPTVTFYGVWDSGSLGAWAVGEGGAITSFDGSVWNWEIGPSNSGLAAGPTLRGIWGSSTSDIWAVGSVPTDGGTTAFLRHKNGTSWADRSSEIPGTALFGIWGSGSTDVWACGEGGVWHWNGTAWSFSAGSSATRLRSIWGSGPSDVWAVGDAGATLHWNGTAWSSMTNGTELDAVWGSAPNDVWASSAQGALMHWDGSTWSTSTTASVHGIWGSSSSDVWTVGESGEMHHGSGTTWTDPSATHAALTSLWGTSSSDVWASGDATLHWDGTQWSIAKTSASPPPTNTWSSGPNDAWKVSESGIFHFDGNAWTLSKAAGASAIWGNSANDVWAVEGSTTGVDGTWHWDGSTWSTFPVTTPGQLHAVWGSAASDVWAVGDQGAVLHWDGRVWSASESGTANALRAVWGVSGSVWIAGDAGTILHR
jgi:hypothetical protein